MSEERVKNEGSLSGRMNVNYLKFAKSYEHRNYQQTQNAAVIEVDLKFLQNRERRQLLEKKAIEG